MAIAFRTGSFSSASGDGVASIAPVIDADVAVGDLMVLGYCWSGGSGRAPVQPSGWTPAGAQNNGTNFGMACYVKIAASGDVGGSASVNADITGGNSTMLAGVLSYSGVDATTPQDATATGANNGFGTSQDSPTITTVTNGAMVVSIVGHRRVSTFTPVDPTDRSGGGISVNVASTDLSMAFGEFAMPTAGASGVMDWTASGSENGSGISIALRPSSGTTYTRTATPVTVAIADTPTRTATPITIAIADTATRTATPVTVAISDTLTRTATPVTISITDVTTLTRTATPVTISIIDTPTRTATPVTVAIADTQTRSANPVTIAIADSLTRTATPVTISVSTPDTRTATPITIAISDTPTLTATPVAISIADTATLTATPVTIAISDGEQTPKRGKTGGRGDNHARMVIGHAPRYGRAGGRK